MRVKDLLKELSEIDPEALVIVEYPPHRCNSKYGLLPGLANVDTAVRCDKVAYHVDGHNYNENEIRLRVERDQYQ